MPRVVSLSPLTWETGMSRRSHAVVRVGYGPRGMPAGLVGALDGLLPDGMTFATFDLNSPAKPAFYLNAFRTGQGPMKRDGRPPAEGFYLFRHGLVIAHHPGGSRADGARVGQYLAERLTGPGQASGQREQEPRWVHEERIRPGSGWRGGGTGHRDPRRQRPYEEQPREEGPRHHRGGARRPRTEPKAPAAPDPYTVLGVERAASDEEIRKAYKAALKLNHPDRVAHLSPALQAFALAQTQAIREAWDAIRADRGL